MTDSCKAHGGFYLGSIGGSAAILAQEYVKSLDILEYPELGMEAVWKMEVEGLPPLSWWMTKGITSSNRFRRKCEKCVAGQPA